MPNSGGSELAVLQRHLPQIVVTRFLNNPERLRGPESSSFLAAVALFDISGFSSLGSRLSEDERRRSKEGGKTSHGSTNNNSTAAPSPTAAAIHQAANQGPTSVSARTRSGSILSSPSKAKSRGSQPMSLLSGLGSPSTRSLNSLSRRDTSHRQMCDEDSTLDDEDDPLPSDIMRQRRTSSMSSSSMSFMHGPKSAIVSQGIAVESLTTTLNKSLEPVINVILEHGGDIVKFAGDALIVMWETEATQNKVTPSGELVYRAVCCAIEALRALGAAVAASTEHENEDTHLTLLGMHVGIGVSQVTGNHVGGVLNRWEFYLSGDANRQMSSAEESAQKGQLALSPESYEALQGRLDKVPELVVACHYSGNYLVQEVPDVSFCSTVTEEQRARASSVVHEVGAELLGCLRSYVPGAIASSLQKGLMLTPCRLNVTVAFVKLEGVVGIKNAQDQLQVIHQTLCNIQECAYKAQGTLRQFVIDDKGAVAIVAIGLPPFFHENNAFRGVKFACYVLESGVRASIGVTTGSAFCGSVGSSARAEYAVVGDSINLAARLMAAAPDGEIFCDDRTHKETKDSIHFRDKIEMTVKGKAEPIQVFPVQRLPVTIDKAVSAIEEITCPAPYGSSNLLDAVPLFRSPTKNGDTERSDARGLFVCGDSGTGKTMLLNHVIQRQSVQCFKGSGDSIDTAADFHAWRDIARNLAAVMVSIEPHKMSLTRINAALAKRTSFSTLMDPGITAIIDLARSNSSTGHRPSQQGRPSRTSTLTTHEEATYDLENEMGSDRSSSSDDDDDDDKSRQAGDARPTPQLVSVLDYLVLHHQVSKSTLDLLYNWFPHDDDKTTGTMSVDKAEGNLKALRHVLLSMMSVVSAVKPIMLVFDNAQWMDNRSLNLVLKVLEELPNVYFLLAARGMSKHSASSRSMLLALVMSLPSVTTQQMSCFTYQATSLFLCQYYHITIMDTQVLDFVFERTEGNPAALIKLLNSMLESKYISIEPEHNNILILKNLDEMDTMIPQHIRARVMSIVDSLDSLAQTALKLLSINPQPSEERMINGVLALLSASCQDANASGEIHGIRLKPPRPTSEVSLLRQVRMSLAPSEKSLLTIDAQNKLYFFNTEEMRLVVYDTMLPSQRKVLHGLYAEWLQSAATKPAHIPPSLTPINSASSTTGTMPVADNPKAARPLPYQQYALLGYHLSQSDNPRDALEAYFLGAEGALEASELGFAEDCMHTSTTILSTHHRIRDLSELDIILLRSRIEFISGTIAVENNDLTLAVMHLSYITRLFTRKGSVLRHYTSGLLRDNLLVRSVASVSRRTSLVMSSVEASPTAPGCFGVVPNSTGLDSIRGQCMPRLFTFNNIYPSAFKSPARRNRDDTSISNPVMLSTRMKSGRIQPEQTLQALDQVNFYRRKASALIKQINYVKKKEDDMHSHIRKFAQKSLQTKDKR